jgi:hypothetical protein
MSLARWGLATPVARFVDAEEDRATGVARPQPYFFLFRRRASMFSPSISAEKAMAA